MQRALLMEEAFGLSVFALLAESLPEVLGVVGGERVPGVWDALGPFWRVFMLPDDLAAYRRKIQEFKTLMARPYHQLPRDSRGYLESHRLRFGGLLTALIMPAFINTELAAAQADARHQLCRLAIAMTAYRAKHGKYPEKLDDLVPGHLSRVPIDPFDGQPLRMKRLGERIVLYSVYRNGKDDGGTSWNTSRSEGDLLFWLR
jgi:hypothetical protein